MAKYNIRKITEKEAAYRSLVSPGTMDKLEQQIYDIIIIQKKYRDKGYSAKDLAEELNTNTRYISAVVNVRMHMNYTSLVNQQRIREAMTMLTDKRCLDMNIAEIADAVGFSNRQSFYAAFYKYKGMTPREYRIKGLGQQPSLAGKPKKRGRRPKMV